MSQNFITTNGSVVIERNILFVKTAKLNFAQSAVGQWLWALVPMVSIAISLSKESQTAKWASVLVSILVFSKNLQLLKKLVFDKSFASRIPVQNILSFTTEDDSRGLETLVHLKLSSGRTRTVSFRTIEQQFEPFLQHLPQPLEAVRTR